MTLLEPVDTRRELSWQPMWFGLWVVLSGFGVFLHADPHGHGTHQELGLPPCPSALLFDRPCPGCGLTTSWTALLHGNLSLAFSAHPLGPFLYLLFTLSALGAIYGFATHRRLVLNSPEMSRTIMAFAMCFLAFGLVRMATTPHFRTAAETSILVGLAK